MAKATNIVIKRQGGSDSTYMATWEFNSTQKITSPGGIKVGDYVTVKSGATWYNGVSIASFVFGDSWRVDQISGNRAVLGRNASGSHNIQSPINVNNLVGGSGGTSTTVDTLDGFYVAWFYGTGDGIWFKGSEIERVAAEIKYSLYNPPSNASDILVHVTPISKTRKVNGVDTAYWTAELGQTTYSMIYAPPDKPSTPSVEVDKYELTATINNVTDGRTDEIQFEVYDGSTLFNTGTSVVKAAMASFKCAVNAGGSYRVRARAANYTGPQQTKKAYSDWTEFTSPATTIPSTPSAITQIRGASSTSVYLEWAEVNSADSYEVEYTTNVNYFDGSSETTTVSNIEFNHYTVTGLESGDEYFFRVRATNDKGSSGWSEIKSVVIGKDPAAPTTWSSASTVIVGDPLNLYWVHNAEDGSRQTYAEVEITVGDDVQTETIHTEPPSDEEEEDEEEKAYSYAVDTSKYTEGTKIKWRVRTAGITKTYGDWSIQRTVDIYAPPTLELNITNKEGGIINVLQTFPFFIKGLAGPKTQEPIGYHVTITANSSYETFDSIGRAKIVNAGDSMYSKYIDTSDPLLLEMTPSNIDLQNGIEYTVTVTVSMNSGLTAIASKTLEVSWTDETYPLDAEIAIDTNTYVAYVTPYSRDEDGLAIENLSLAVYRREFDGTYTEIASGLDSAKNTVVTDPHPALDYARYRVVAVDNSTGAVTFYDPPGYPVGGIAVILQWDEVWTDFDASNTDVRAVPPYAGSMLMLPYNIDVSDDVTPDVSLVNYIGRDYPVSYYGTAIDSKSTWNMAIPKTDVETLYALRRLQIWKGDVYVREPSGSGYWANVGVSFSKKHNDLTIPITLSITRVTGGM